jgi:long-chain acyl-CoA synthetase
MAMAWVTGMKAGFYGGDVLKLVEDIGILAPTVFPSVPRLYNKIYGKIKTGIDAKPGCLKWLINKAIATKL